MEEATGTRGPGREHTCRHGRRSLGAVQCWTLTWGVDLVHERRLMTLAALYAPLAAGGAWLSLHYGVGALPGGDPPRDLAFRDTGLRRRCSYRWRCSERRR
jgi:hypothetical protein